MKKFCSQLTGLRVVFILLMCFCTLVLFAATSAMAAEAYIPVSVESYTMSEFDTPCIKKIYQLSLTDDPAGIPAEDFEEYGYRYHLTDITQEASEGVDRQWHTETITRDSDTNDMAKILKKLDAQKDFTTEDGYSGVLLLDQKSVKVAVKGYKTNTKNLSVNRTYDNLADADLALIPKTTEDSGKTLNLTNVQWSGSPQEDGSMHYTAVATYAGSTSSRYATGYTVTATYTGQLAKTSCSMINYTAIFTGTKLEEKETETEEKMTEETAEMSEEDTESGTQTVRILRAEQREEDAPSQPEWLNPEAEHTEWKPDSLAVINTICWILILLLLIALSFHKFMERKTGKI